MGKQKSFSVDRALTFAEKAAIAGDKDKAMKYYEAILVKHPDHQEAMSGVRALNPNSLLRADIDELKVSVIEINDGPGLRRFRARAKGRGTRITKRNSHITVQVADE